MEIIIYVAIVTVFMVILANFVVDVVRSATRSRIVKEVEFNAQLTLNRIVNEVRRSQAINEVNTTSLTLVDVNNNISIWRYQADTAQLELVSGGNIQNLTPPTVRITSLSFNPIQAGGVTKGVVIYLSVAQGSMNLPLLYQYDTQLSTTAFVRQLLY